MAHKTKTSANDAGHVGIRVQDYIGDHAVEFVESQDFTFKKSGEDATRLVFKVLRSTSENLGQGTEVEQVVFVGEKKYNGDYYQMEMRAAAAAIHGLDSSDDEQDWEALVAAIDGPDNKLAGAQLIVRVYQSTGKKKKEKKQNPDGPDEFYNKCLYMGKPSK